MEDFETLKGYFNKLQKIIAYDADFTFLGIKLIKKNKIDDLLCCILASFPDIYKSAMKNKLRNEDNKEFTSFISYRLLFDAIKGKFILNSGVYAVNEQQAKAYMASFLRDYPNDLRKIEKMQ